MNPLIKRRENDLKKLKELEKKYKFFKVIKVAGNPIKDIWAELNLKIPISSSKFANKIEIKIELPSKYPMESPKFSVKPPVYNPNVFESGKVCMGNKWMVSNTLDLEVERLIKILVLDPQYINTKSAANSNAVDWFLLNIKKFPLIKL